MIPGVMVDDFARPAIRKIGDTITIKTTGPENHETEAIRSKKLTITFEIKALPTDRARLDEADRGTLRHEGRG